MEKITRRERRDKQQLRGSEGEGVKKIRGHSHGKNLHKGKKRENLLSPAS